MIAGFALLLLAGCSSMRQSQIYPMSFDQTYSSVISALNDVKSWRVVETDQLNGFITLETGGFFQPRRAVRVIVKHLEPFQTKVEIDQHKTYWFNPDFIKAIDTRVNERALTYPR